MWNDIKTHIFALLLARSVHLQNQSNKFLVLLLKTNLFTIVFVVNSPFHLNFCFCFFFFLSWSTCYSCFHWYRTKGSNSSTTIRDERSWNWGRDMPIGNFSAIPSFEHVDEDDLTLELLWLKPIYRVQAEQKKSLQEDPSTEIDKDDMPLGGIEFLRQAKI